MSDEIAPMAAVPLARSLRTPLLAGLAVFVLAAAATAAWLWWREASRFVSTDNAYVAADVASVMAQTSGTISEVRVEDTQRVTQGEVLVVVDAADARLQLEQAQAELARVEQRVRQYVEDSKTAAAQVGYAQAVVNQAAADLARRRRLLGSGFVSTQDLSNFQSGYDTAVASLAVARSHYESQRSLISGGDANRHPEVLAARSAVASAQLALARTVVRAPIGGVVIQKRVTLGQRLQAGAPLLSVVPLEHAYVVANYKEGQLERVRPGQNALLSADLYGSNVTYHGHVAGLSGGTGAAFAVIPAQNATGSWIKVVQRVPVRIDLDAAELRQHPLRVGLSMQVKIDIRN
jgi:membrane fusion protein (multidrug efflux system)